MILLLKNKLSFVFILCFLSVSAFANGDIIIPTPKPQIVPIQKPASNPSIFDGFYLGGGLNLTGLTGKADRDIGYYSPNGNPGEQKLPLSDYNPGINLFGGYGKTFKRNFYLGGELFANFSPVNTKGLERTDYSPANTEITLADVKSYFTLGAALRLGYLLTPKTMVYLLAGGDYTQFKIDSSESDRLGYYYLNSNSGKETKNVFGFMPGIGIESMIYKHLALRMQYTYSFYPSFTDSYTITDSNQQVPPKQEKIKYKLARNTLALSLVYRFSPITEQNSYIPTIQDITATSPFDGFYVGAGPELRALQGTVTYDRFSQVIGQNDGFWTKEKYRISSYDPGIIAFGGYGGSFKQKVYVGTEVFAGYSPFSSKATLDSRFISQTKAKIESDYSLGADIKGGYLITPTTMFYVLLGVDFTQFKIKSEEGSGFDGHNEDVNSSSETKSKIGLMPGIGLEKMLNQHWALRAQYTYIWFPHFTDSYQVPAEVDKNPITKTATAKYNPSENVFTLAAVYHF